MTLELLENKFIVSAILIISVLLLRWIVVHHLASLESDEKELPRRWINSAKNAFNLCIMFGLIIIWLSELQFVALSIATFIVALVVATREFIQCFIGSLYHASTRSFGIGDWVKIGGHNGEVSQNNWLTTTLLEVDMDGKSYGYSGKTLVLPNNLLITNPIQNMNYIREFVPHSFSIVRDMSEVNPVELKKYAISKAQELCEPFLENAAQLSQKYKRKLGINIPDGAPSVRLETTNIGKDSLTITLYCPTKQAVELEQTLIDYVLEHFHGLREQKKSTAASSTK